jgi:hypothetical protein
MEDPMMDPVDMGVLNAITEATMITTRLMVFPTACVTGLTYLSIFMKVKTMGQILCKHDIIYSIHM